MLEEAPSGRQAEHGRVGRQGMGQAGRRMLWFCGLCIVSPSPMGFGLHLPRV